MPPAKRFPTHIKGFAKQHNRIVCHVTKPKNVESIVNHGILSPELAKRARPIEQDWAARLF